MEDEFNILESHLLACFEAKASGLDETVNMIDSALNADLKWLTPAQQAAVVQSLDNIRVQLVYQREKMIQAFANDAWPQLLADESSCQTENDDEQHEQ